MADMQLLRAKLKYNGMTYQEAGEFIGVGRDTFSRKLRDDGKALTLGEIRELVRIMGLTQEEVWQIFFGK